MTSRYVVIKNAIANVARGGAAAIVALLLPPFLTSALSPDRYSAWALLLQLSAYVFYLDFGLQTAVARFFAQSVEKSDLPRRDQIVNSAFVLLTVAGAIAFVVILGVSALLPHLFHQVPSSLLGELRSSLILLSASLCIGLPASVFTGMLIGMQRNEFPALAIGGAKLASGLCLILAVRYTGSLIALALIAAFWNILSYALQYVACRKLLREVRLSLTLVTRKVTRELVSYCASLSAWSVGMLLVTGLDLTIVGYVSFKDVGPYSVAATLVTFVAGINSAVFSALITPTAVIHARQEHRQLGDLVIRTTRLGIYLTAALIVPLIMGAQPLLTAWVGPRYANLAAPLLQILLLANLIRLTGSPYSVAIIGTGQQRLVVMSPLVEGAVNLIASVIGAFYFGVIGVAAGTLIGALAGMLFVVLYNVPRTREIQMTLRDYGLGAIGRATLMITPLVLSVVLSLLLANGLIISGIIASGALLSTALIIISEGIWPNRRYAA